MIIASLALMARKSCTQVNLDGSALPVKKLKGTDPVEALDLSCKSLKVASAVVIASLIRANASLTVLILKDNGLGPQGAKHLSDALKVNKSITELDISNGRGSSSGDIKAEGAKYIAEALLVNASLTKIE